MGYIWQLNKRREREMEGGRETEEEDQAKVEEKNKAL